MLEVDIHDFWETEDTHHYCDSIANSGRNDIGQVTWDNAKTITGLLKTNEDIQAARDYFSELCGEWRDLPDNEIQALFIQEISAQIQEFEACENIEDYERQAEAGRVSGLIFFHDDRMHIQLTH